MVREVRLNQCACIISVCAIILERIHLLFQSTLIADKSAAGAQSTILLDNATEISSAVQFPTNKKTHKE